MTYQELLAAAKAATDVSALLFGKGEACELSVEALDALRDEVPFVELPALAAEGIDAADQIHHLP